MSPARRAIRAPARHPVNFTGILAVIFGLTAAVMGLVLVVRGDSKGLGEWGLLIGTFTTGAGSLLARHDRSGRATDPSTGSTVETTTTTTTPPEQEAEG